MILDDGAQMFVVVLNDEEQYSIWPQNKALPPGWRASGYAGLKTDCLAHIRIVWTDMRPRRLRDAVAVGPTPAPSCP
jgi:MbtH protein